MDSEFIDSFKDRHLLIAGEVGIDEYIWGETRRISPEAPVPVVEVESTESKLGLAANVAQNVTALGARATIVSVRGEDADGQRIEWLMKKAGIGTHFIEDASRPTLRKTRIIAGKQHIVRVDYEKSHRLDPKVGQQFKEAICDQIEKTDGIILQDYGKGLWNADIASFIKQAKQKNRPVFVDPSRLSPPSIYHGATLLSPNLDEAKAMAGHHSHIDKDDDKTLMTLAQVIIDAANAEHIIITCGSAGMVSLSGKDTQLSRIPTYAREVFDVTGAGDTVIAVLALMHIQGHPLPLCMQVANAAAGKVVARIGTSTVTPAELKKELERIQKRGLLAPSNN